MSHWQQISQYFQQNPWMLQLLTALVIGLISSWFITILFRKVDPALKKIPQLWVEPMVAAVYQPIKVFIWLMVLSVFIEIAAPHFF